MYQPKKKSLNRVTSMTVLLLQHLKLIILLVLVGFVVGLSRVGSEGPDRRLAELVRASGWRTR
jgi:hypothetical protein